MTPFHEPTSPAILVANESGILNRGARHHSRARGIVAGDRQGCAGLWIFNSARRRVSVSAMTCTADDHGS